MIPGKVWHSIKAQLNKLAGAIWSADPIAQMQYEHDLAVEQLKTGREGLEQYRALVERVGRQVAEAEKHLASLDAKTKAYLAAGDRETAARFALEIERVRQELAENESQLAMHEAAYENNVAKIKHAAKKLAEVRTRIANYDAELKMTTAEAEIAKLAGNFNADVTTDFNQVEQMLQEKISLNRAKTRVAADLSGVGAIDAEREAAMESAMAQQALANYEKRLAADGTQIDTTPSKRIEHQ